MEGNQPEKKFRAGAISATVWKNAGKNRTGQPVEYYTISIERGYKDKNGQWQSTNSFRVMDLPKLSLVVDKAFEFLVMKQKETELDIEIEEVE